MSNGLPAPGPVPWLVSLMLRRGEASWYRHPKCGAALLSATVAVTAAHCVCGPDIDWRKIA